MKQVSNDEDHIVLCQHVDGLDIPLHLDIPLQNTKWNQSSYSWKKTQRKLLFWHTKHS